MTAVKDLRPGWRRLTSWLFTHFCGPADRVVHILFSERCPYCKGTPWA